MTHQVSAQHASELLRNVMRAGSMLGAQTLTTVTSAGMQRLLRLNGFKAARVSKPEIHLGSCIVALMIACDEANEFEVGYEE